MYTVTQAQILEFLVWTANSVNRPGRELKCLVQFNGSLWYGNFLKYDEQDTPYLETDYGYDSRIRIIYDSVRADSFLQCRQALPDRIFKIGANDKEHNEKVFAAANQIIQSYELTDEKINSFLYDVESIDGKVKLPFIHLPDTIQVLAFLDK